MNIFDSQITAGKGIFSEQIYVAATSAPTGTITSQPAPDGQSQRFVGTSTDATGGTYTLTGSDGGVTVGPSSFSIAGNTFDFTVSGLQAGSYAPTLTVSGPGGMGSVTGTTSFSILGVAGGGTFPDDVVPVMAGVITASAITTSSFTLSWSAATDNTGVTGYEVSVDNGTTYVDVGNVLTTNRTGLASGTLFNTKVRAYDAAANKAVPLSLDVTTTASADVTAPAMVGSITISAVTASGFTASWSAATDAVGVAGYEFSTDNGATYSSIGNVLTYSPAGLASNTLFNVKVRAFDTANNKSASLSTTVTTATPADTTVPTLPGTITISSITTGGFTASWSAGSDNVGVMGYEISVDTGTPAYTQLGNVLTYTKTGLAAGSAFTVRVRSYDAAGNRSTSLTASITTAAAVVLATTVTLTFTSRAGVAQANLTGLKWAFFDQALPNLLHAPVAYGISGTTSASGVAVFNISGTTLAPGATGWIIVSNSDGTASQSNLISFAGPVVVA